MGMLKDIAVIMGGASLVLAILALRFSPFLLVAWVIVHFVKKFW